MYLLLVIFILITVTIWEWIYLNPIALNLLHHLGQHKSQCKVITTFLKSQHLHKTYCVTFLLFSSASKLLFLLRHLPLLWLGQCSLCCATVSWTQCQEALSCNKKGSRQKSTFNFYIPHSVKVYTTKKFCYQQYCNRTLTHVQKGRWSKNSNELCYQQCFFCLNHFHPSEIFQTGHLYTEWLPGNWNIETVVILEEMQQYYFCIFHCKPSPVSIVNGIPISWSVHHCQS